MARGIPISAMVLMMPCALQAQERLVIEEVIVTAQRVEESAQKVPIALNAFDETGIEDRQIIGIGDLSLFVPNLSYNTNNVGDTHVTIRGVGSLVSRRDSESGVSLHVNQVPLPSGQPPFEIYDLARIEVLRGPRARCTAATPRAVSSTSLPTGRALTVQAGTWTWRPVTTTSCGCAAR